LNKEEMLKNLDACLWGMSKYEHAGSFGQAVHIRVMLMVLASVREEIAEGTVWKGKLFTPSEIVISRPSTEEVAEQIIKELNNE